MVGRLGRCPVGCLVGYVVCLLVVWLVGWLFFSVGCLFGSMFVWGCRFDGCLVVSLAGRWLDCLVDCLSDCYDCLLDGYLEFC